ncbi:MAG: flagellar filament capping protein FliD [Proteobacteria bacterium]|nr:flagellar filament capping protein FliD [Pseudomonadota bacterium]
MPGEVSMGRAIVDPKGQKPVRVGMNHGGLDMQATGKEIKEATLASTKKQSDAIEKNKTGVLPAISALQEKVKLLQSDAIALSNYLGDRPGIESSFKSLVPTVSKSGEFSTTSFVDVTLDSAVAKPTSGSVSMRVLQLAVEDSRITVDTIKDSSNNPITSINQELGISGSFTINGGATINVRTTDTLYSIVSAINNSNSGVQANFSQNGFEHYLTLTGTKLAKSLFFSDNDGLLQTHFGIDTGPTDIGNLQAKIECDVTDGKRGVVTKTYEFDSNIVKDLIPGATLKLLNTTKNSGGGYDNLNINISNNSKEACDKILAFYQHYNEIRETLNRNLMTDDDGNPLDPEAVMVRSPLIKKLNEDLRAISHFTLVGSERDDFVTVRDIGIVRDETATGFQAGIFTIADAQKLLAAIQNNFEKVKKLFGNYTTVSNSNFRVTDLGPSLDPMLAGRPITVTLSNVGGKYYSRFLCGNNDTGNVEQKSSSRLVGKENSVFDKITIDYKGAPVQDGDSVTFTLTATQGLGVSVSNTLGSLLTKETIDKKTGRVVEADGDFSIEVKRIQQKNEKLEKQVKRIEKNAEREEKRWIAQAARYDAMKASYSSLSKQLESMSMAHRRD